MIPKIIRKVQFIFGKYETDCEYWVKLEDIIITPQFKECPPNKNKLDKKWKYYKRNDVFQSKIKLLKNFTLVDGYTTYLLAYKDGLTKVPVYFVD